MREREKWQMRDLRETKYPADLDLEDKTWKPTPSEAPPKLAKVFTDYMNNIFSSFFRLGFSKKLLFIYLFFSKLTWHINIYYYFNKIVNHVNIFHPSFNNKNYFGTKMKA